MANPGYVKMVDSAFKTIIYSMNSVYTICTVGLLWAKQVVLTLFILHTSVPFISVVICDNTVCHNIIIYNNIKYNLYNICDNTVCYNIIIYNNIT